MTPADIAQSLLLTVHLRVKRRAAKISDSTGPAIATLYLRDTVRLSIRDAAALLNAVLVESGRPLASYPWRGPR